MLELVKRFIEKVVRMEKNKYMRERVYYQRNNEIAMYEIANRAYLTCRKDVMDNLIKQAKTVCKPDPIDWQKYLDENFDDANVDVGVDDIAERISLMEARKYLEMWMRIKSMFAEEKNRLQELRAKGAGEPEDIKNMAKFLDVSDAEALE